MSSEDFSLTGAALAIDLLLCELRNGTFYQDHDESQMLLHDAEIALDVLANAALDYSSHSE